MKRDRDHLSLLCLGSGLSPRPRLGLSPRPGFRLSPRPGIWLSPRLEFPVQSEPTTRIRAEAAVWLQRCGSVSTCAQGTFLSVKPAGCHLLYGHASLSSLEPL